MNLMILIFTVFLGLCLGSFIHVAINRFSPNDTVFNYLFNITFPRSKCPSCKQKLLFLSLIPLVSWLIQKGRCRYCSCIIPVHYPLTELAVSVYCVGIILVYGLTIWSIILILLGLYFFVLAVIDFQYLLLPDYFTYTILFTGLLLAYLGISSITFINALFGMIFGYALLWIPAAGYYLIKKNIGLGGGDIKLLSALGTWIDYTQLPNLLLFSACGGIGYFVLYNYINKPTAKKTMIPFGPYLLISAYGILLFFTN